MKIILTSAKTGEGIESLVEAVIERFPRQKEMPKILYKH